MNLYTEIIMGSYEDGQTMVSEISKLGAFFRDEKKPLMLNVDKFLKAYNSFCQIFNIETYLFGQIVTIQKRKKVKSILGMLQRDSKDELLTAQEFGQALKKINV